MKNVLVVYNALLEGPAKVHEQSVAIKESLILLLNPEHEHHLIGIALAIYSAWINPRILENTLPDSRDFSPHVLFSKTLKKRGRNPLELPHLPSPFLVNTLKAILLFYMDSYEEAIELCKSERSPEASFAELVFSILGAHRSQSPLELSKASLDVLKHASDQQIIQADLLLGHCYQHGYGVLQDVDLCLAHFRKAAMLGSLDAIEELNIIAQTLFTQLPKEPMRLFVRESFPETYADYPKNACFLIRLPESDDSFALVVRTEKNQRITSIPKAPAESFLYSKLKGPHESIEFSTIELFKLISLYGDETKSSNAWEDLHWAAFQGGMHSQFILGLLHEEFLPTLPAAEQTAEKQHIQAHYLLAAKQKLLVAQYRYGIFCQDVLLDIPHAIHYLSATLEKRPYEHPVDKLCQDDARIRLKSLLFNWFLANLHLLSTNTPPPSSVWNLLNLLPLIDPGLNDAELLPVWLLFQGMVRLHSIEYIHLHQDDITTLLDDFFVKIDKLIKANPHFFETFERKIEKAPHASKHSIEGWVHYFKGYTEWALLNKDHLTVPNVILKTFESSYLKGNAMAAAELACIHLELMIKIQGSKNSTPHHVREAAKWANLALDMNPNILALQLFNPILSDDQELSVRLEACIKVCEQRQDAEILNVLFCFIQALPNDPVPTFAQALLFEKKANLQFNRYFLYKACDALCQLNKIAFPKSLLVETFFRLGEQIQKEPIPESEEEKSLHLKQLQTCFSEAAQGEHKEALAFMAKHLETGGYGFNRNPKEALTYVKKLIKIETEDAVISSLKAKADELQALIKQIQKATQSQKKHNKTARRKKNHQELPEKAPMVISGASLEALESEEEEIATPAKARTPTPHLASPVEEAPVLVIHRPGPRPSPKAPIRTEEQWESLVRTCEDQRKSIQKLIQTNHNLQHALETSAKEHVDAIRQLHAQYSETKRHELSQSDEVVELGRQISALKAEIRTLKEELQEATHRRRFFKPKPTVSVESQTPIPSAIPIPIFDEERQCYTYEGHPITHDEAITFNRQIESLLPMNIIHDLGVCALLGLGRDKDINFAKKLLQISAAQGLVESRKILEDYVESTSRCDC